MKMNDIMSVTARVRDYLQVHNPDLLSLLAIGQYFELSEEVMNAASELGRDMTTRRDERGGGFVPEDARLPARPTILWFRELMDNLVLCYEPRSEAGKIHVLVLSTYMPPLVFGGYIPGSVEALINRSDKTHEEHAKITETDRAQTIVLVAAVLATINAPRITKRVVAGTRQSRRAAARKIGANPEQWHRVEWDLTKPKVERGERLGKGWHMPLHYTRGHWRRCEEGRGKAVLLPGKGWHTWVDGYWSGHPSYGIKRAVYAPRIGEKGAGGDRHAAFEGSEAAQ